MPINDLFSVKPPPKVNPVDTLKKIIKQEIAKIKSGIELDDDIVHSTDCTRIRERSKYVAMLEQNGKATPRDRLNLDAYIRNSVSKQTDENMDRIFRMIQNVRCDQTMCVLLEFIISIQKELILTVIPNLVKTISPGVIPEIDYIVCGATDSKGTRNKLLNVVNTIRELKGPKAPAPTPSIPRTYTLSKEDFFKLQKEAEIGDVTPCVNTNVLKLLAMLTESLSKNNKNVVININTATAQSAVVETSNNKTIVRMTK